MNRVLFDTIERSLKDTPYEALIDQLYRINVYNRIICEECGASRKREEKDLDLMVSVKGMKGLDESLKAYFEMEKFHDDSKLECESCGTKTNSLMGKRI